MNVKNVESTQRKHDDGIGTCEKQMSNLWWRLQFANWQNKGNMTLKFDAKENMEKCEERWINTKKA